MHLTTLDSSLQEQRLATPSLALRPTTSQVPHDRRLSLQLHPSFSVFPEATSGPSFEALKGSTASSSCLWVWCTAGAARCRLKRLRKLAPAVPLSKKPFPTWQTPEVSSKT